MDADISLEAKDIVVCKQGKLILDNLSFRIRKATLTGIIGPNGAGKSTLMEALSGEKPQKGQIFLFGESLYSNPEYWLQRIGFVPAKNILHDHLTLQDALEYIGRLRLPNQSRDQVRKRVNELLLEFGFGEGDFRRSRLIHTLSTGERKKANICSELVTDPPILMLDEPTSNLDPNAEHRLMELLAKYAHSNDKTIIVITHTLNTLEFCDEVIFIENSKISSTGSPSEILERLEADVVNVDKTIPVFLRWSEVFETFKTERSRVEHADCKNNSLAVLQEQVHKDGNYKNEKGLWWHQFHWLLKRYMRVRFNDKRSFWLTLLSGFICGAFLFVLPSNTFERPFDGGAAQLALSQARESAYMMSLTITMLGLITSYTEISKEYHIFEHERRKNLSPFAYFASKWVWLVGTVGLIAPLVLMLFFTLVYRQRLTGFPDASLGETIGWWEELIQFQVVGLLTSQTALLILITLVLACITSITIGLLISILAGKSNRGYLYLSIMVVYLVLFSGLGGNPKLQDLIDFFSFASVGNWAYQGVSSSIDIYCWTGSWDFKEFN
jgi:ABC-type multidrug transport system ATPase subunit